MATELTAEAVYDMTGGRVIPEFVEYVWPGQPSRMAKPHGWYIGRQPLPPSYALALIVDAMKREMGEDYKGCLLADNGDDTASWKAKCTHGSSEPYWGDAPTESKAVIAAYLAWKEGK